MKTKKLVIFVLFTFIGMLEVMAETITVGNLRYSINNDGSSVTLTGHIDGTDATGELLIPESVEYNGTNYTVTAIGGYAFQNYRKLTGSLIIPNTVNSIGLFAFQGCKQITGPLVISNPSTTIADYAFRYCDALVSADLAAVQIPEDCFEDCPSLSNLTLQNTVQRISVGAFGYCTSLTYVNIPSSLTSIGTGAFYNTGLVNVVIPNSVVSLGEGVFNNTPWYNNQPDGVIYANGCCLGYKGEKPTGSLTIENGTRLLAAWAFAYCDGLTSVNLPNTLTRICFQAFLGCTGLTSITIPNSCTFLGYDAFEDCTGLTVVTFGEQLSYIADFAFENCSNITAIHSYAVTPPQLGYCPFCETTNTIPVYVPSESIQAYASSWSCFLNFQSLTPSMVCEITTIPEPAEGGRCFGGGALERGTVCFLTAVTNPGFSFVHWEKNGIPFCTDPSFSFVVTEPATYVAVFVLNHHMITVSTNIEGGGTVFGGGEYAYGSTATISVESNIGYCFTGWSCNNHTCSNTTEYSFIVTEDVSYTAVFKQINLPSIDVSNITETTALGIGISVNLDVAGLVGTGICWSTQPNPSIEGSHAAEFDTTAINRFFVHITGLLPNKTYYACAYAIYNGGVGYGEVVSFKTQKWPKGMLPGLFSIGPDKQVRFSQGNLKYDGSSIWRFSDNQWDYIGRDNRMINYGWAIDLFGWATAHNPNRYYVDGVYNAYPGEYESSLNDHDGSADWGNNVIQNGGNERDFWRTLTYDEVCYLIDSRNTPSGIRFAWAKVNDINGILIFPDNWNPSIFALDNYNNHGGDFSENVISASDWSNILEPNGVVLLPAAGCRYDRTVEGIGEQLHYWTATGNGGDYAYDLYAAYMGFGVFYSPRYMGHSVRLVCGPHNDLCSIDLNIDPVHGGAVSGGGSFLQGQICTLQASPVSGYHFVRWMKNGTQVSTNSNYSFMVSESASFVAEFSPNSISITASVNPSNGGFVSGTGYYNYGSDATLTAIPNSGYRFEKWTKDGVSVSHDLSYSFTVKEDASYEAVFKKKSSITISANPLVGGEVSGAGEYNNGFLCTLVAAANSGYDFVNWTENGTVVSLSSSYSFVVNADRNLTANFAEEDIIVFADSIVKSICVANWDINGDGELSKYEAAMVKSLGEAFRGNSEITSFEEFQFFTGLLSINDRAFYNCYNLTVLTIPNSVACIGKQALYWCRNLTTLIVPSLVNMVGQEAFYYLRSLTSMTVMSETPPSLGANVFYNIPTDIPVYVPCGSIASYQTADGWSTFTNYHGIDCPYHEIVVSANPPSGGTANGAGAYGPGSTCTLMATANPGYTFENWTENGTIVSVEANYSFEVTANRTLVANFTDASGSGKLNGVFSVSENSFVNFSQGNLQYQASSGTWRFANNQYDKVGSYNANVSETYSGWIDLFGWGTSGYNHGAVCYQPWSTSTNYSDYYAYGSSSNNLCDGNGQADWGYNAIANGGNAENSGWRTLTNDEWAYVLNNRTTTSGIRYAKAKVNGVNGVILLPDDWDAGYYSLNRTNTVGASFSSNILSVSQWSTLEQHGAVFLPAAGNRYGTSVDYVGSYGLYWSASYFSSSNAYNMSFGDSELGSSYNISRYFGRSVRLVHSVYVINATSNPAEGGTMSGAGSYQQGQICTMTAAANPGYTFENWTENGTIVSVEANYSFEVTANRTLVANFTDASGSGKLNGVFSVSENSFVNFSQGNLQYQASSGTWRFANNQYDKVGSYNANVSETYSGWIDLFGWGTSGYNHGAVCYQPWSTSTNYSDYYAYGSSSNNLCDGNGQADWGYNAIANGGNAENSGWRTLTNDEWAYVLNNRTTTSGIRYAKAKVNGVNGVILLPDDWDAGYYSLNRTNTVGASFSSNILSVSQWSTLEQHGAVFLPAAGNRYGTSVDYVGSYGFYWSASYSSSSGAYNMGFGDSELGPSYSISRYFGRSVRLARSAHAIIVTPNPAEGGTVSGGGGYNSGSTCTLTAVPNQGYAFVNWTEDGEEVSVDTTYSFTVTGDRTLVANFAAATRTQTVQLSAGWNWFSTYLSGEPTELLQMLENSLGSNGIVIKSNAVSTDYYEDYGWYGDLDDEGLKSSQMYMVKTNAACTVELEGVPANPAEVGITIRHGWNWIGFPCAEAMSVADALAGFQAEDGDILKSSGASTDYYEGFGWYGELETMEPGEGFMYYSNSQATKTVYFQTGAKKSLTGRKN